MKYTKTLELQETRLKLAAGYAATILRCDEAIAVGRHLNYFNSTRQEAIEGYASAIAEIIDSSIDMAVEFQPKFTVDEFMKTVNAITENYKRTHNITY